MSKGRRLIQSQNNTIGARDKIIKRFGDWFVVRTAPESAPMRPKTVSGTSTVLMSEYVKSHIVLK